MLDLAVDQSGVILLVTASSAALLGGMHCAGMCGPLAFLANDWRKAVAYQVGRFASYLALGILAALVGQRLMISIPSDKKWIASALLIGFALWIASAQWSQQGAGRLSQFLWRIRPRGHWLVEFSSLGFLNGFLPCGWLYGFLAAAAATESVPRASAIMVGLWAGSALWLSAFAGFGQYLQRRSPFYYLWGQRILMLVFVGTVVLQQFVHARSSCH